MIRYLRLVLVLLVIMADAIGADTSAHRFVLSYSTEPEVCREFSRLITSETTRFFADSPNIYASTTDGSCYPFGGTVMALEEVAVTEYGYTEINRARLCFKEDYAIVYVSKFQGDRAPRLEQTWKVKAADLNQVLALPPGPLPFEKKEKMEHSPPLDTNATEFAALLEHGEKISDDFSPVAIILGRNYVVERECSGVWLFGADYICNKVIKFTVKTLEVNKRSAPICQFTRPRKK